MSSIIVLHSGAPPISSSLQPKSKSNAAYAISVSCGSGRLSSFGSKDKTSSLLSTNNLLACLNDSKRLSLISLLLVWVTLISCLRAFSSHVSILSIVYPDLLLDINSNKTGLSHLIR